MRKSSFSFPFFNWTVHVKFDLCKLLTFVADLGFAYATKVYYDANLIKSFLEFVFSIEFRFTIKK